jgi:hypothetical protein
MTNAPMVQLLLDAGYETGWALLGDELTVWLLEEDPPAPLKRPVATKTTK